MALYETQTSYYVQSNEGKYWSSLHEPGFDTLEEAQEDIKDWPVFYLDKELRIIKETITHEVIPYSHPTT